MAALRGTVPILPAGENAVPKGPRPTLQRADVVDRAGSLGPPAGQLDVLQEDAVVQPGGVADLLQADALANPAAVPLEEVFTLQLQKRREPTDLFVADPDISRRARAAVAALLAGKG